jgi:hypothetical protein
MAGKPDKKVPTIRKRPKAGRPEAEIDLRVVEGLGAIMATHEEVSTAIGISISTFRKKLKAKPEVKEAYERGKNSGRITLRRELMKSARAGNARILIFLAKNWLGYTENPEESKPVEEEFTRYVEESSDNPAVRRIAEDESLRAKLKNIVEDSDG